ncbi:MAG: chemotaxis response regulator protein-glutamate methylesterase [Polyangiales bacterium]
MSAPIRVMIVDDSAVVRRLLTQALARHPEVEVVGSAVNGAVALQKLPQINPEVLVLDIEMPEMDGITMLNHLRVTHPRLPVVMFSTLTERGASVTFDALAAGASDYVLKPTTQAGNQQAADTLEQVVGTSLVPKIVALARSRFGAAMQAAMAVAHEVSALHPTGKPSSIPPALVPIQPVVRSIAGSFAPRPRPTLVARPQGPALGPMSLPAAPPKLSLSSTHLEPGPGVASFSEAPTGTNITVRGSAPRASAPTANASLLQRAAQGTLLSAGRKSTQIIAIASSTGGPNALAELLPRLPGGLPVPIVIVQHMPPIFTRCLAERLAARCALTIREAEHRERLLPSHVYIAPGNRHLEVVREGDAVLTQLSDGPQENSCRPAADVMFRSVARTYGASALCVVLTGMGQDGLRGARQIHDAGGRVLVQSGPTCVIWGMPRAVEEAGLAEAVVPLPELGAAVLARVGNGLLPLRDPPPEKGGGS